MNSENVEPGYEFFIPVINSDGVYEVSNHGSIRSVTRVTKTGVRGGKVLKPHKDKDGYLTVGIVLKDERKTLKLHRLVAEHFIPNPDNYPTVNHLDGNKANNRVENLEWSTYQKNAIHRNSVLGRKRYTINYPEEMIIDIVEGLNKGNSVLSVARKHRISDKAVRRLYERNTTFSGKLRLQSKNP